MRFTPLLGCSARNTRCGAVFANGGPGWSHRPEDNGAWPVNLPHSPEDTIRSHDRIPPCSGFSAWALQVRRCGYQFTEAGMPARCELRSRLKRFGCHPARKAIAIHFPVRRRYHFAQTCEPTIANARNCCQHLLAKKSHSANWRQSVAAGEVRFLKSVSPSYMRTGVGPDCSQVRTAKRFVIHCAPLGRGSAR
jgi:hypothetical protein